MFEDLVSFLNIYNTLGTCLKQKEDFTALAQAYCARIHADNVVHAEIFFDPQTHPARGIAFNDVCDGLNEGLQEYRDKHNMSLKLIACILRDHTVGTQDADKDKDKDKDKEQKSEECKTSDPSAWQTIKQVCDMCSVYTYY